MKYQSPAKSFQFPLLLIASLLLLAGCDQGFKIPKTESAFVLPEAAAVEGLQLSHPTLGKFDLDSIKGKWSLFFFGYTHCPDVCPTELFMMSQMMKQIEENPAPGIQAPQVVFISLDPQRDAPEALQQYAGFYHPSFIGVTGEQSAVDQLSKSMGVYYQRVYHLNGKVLDPASQKDVPEGLEDSYLINHSAAIFLTNPKGQLQAILKPPHEPAVVIRDLASIQKAWR